MSAALVVATLAWASTSPQVEELAPLVVPRTAHTATVLSDGRVLIIGGLDSAGTALAAAEIFDPTTQTSTAIGELLIARTGHTATLLSDGRVLVAGGTNATGPLTSAEIFDPAALEAGFRLLSANMGTARTQHTATLLSSGKVLIAGGDDAGTAEIFDPATESFSSTLLLMADPRSGHTATLFSNDSVLLAGGQTDSMEFFNTTDETFTLDTQKMSSVRTGQQTIALSDTRVFFFGGDTNNTIEEFNLSTDTLSLKATMEAPASTATLLANGKILILRPDIAGIYAPDATDQAPTVNAVRARPHRATPRHTRRSPHRVHRARSGTMNHSARTNGASTLSTTGTWLDPISDPGVLALQRRGQTATEIGDGKKILVAGGTNAQNEFVSPVALFNPARIWTDRDDYTPDDPVVLSGSGWKPNENIYLFAVDSETEQWTYGSTVTADANGAFTVNPYFIVQLAQAGVKFSVTAVGSQSAMQANVTFTDATGVSTASVTIDESTCTTPTSAFSQGQTVCAKVAVTATSGGGGAGTFFIDWINPSGTQVRETSETVSVATFTDTLATTIASPAGTWTVRVCNTSGCSAGAARASTTFTLAGPASKYIVTSSDNNPVAGTAVTITAQLADAGGNPVRIANKTVTWSNNGTGGSFASATSPTNGSGVATVSFTTSTVAGTVHTVTATDNSSPTNFTGISGNITTKAATATKLAITSVNGGSNPTAGTGFSVVVQSQDANGNPSNVTANAGVTLSVNTGTGTLGGNVSGTIGINSNSVTISGVTYSKAESGVILTATRTTGNTLTPGNSAPFTVDAGTATKLVITGSATQTAGTSQNLTITAKDSAGNVASSYTGDKSLTFSGANASTNPVTNPTVTNKTGTAVNFGTVTTITFTNGVATVSGSSNGVMTLYKVETATIAVTDGTISAAGADRLTVTVSVGNLDHFALSLTTPQANGVAFTGTNTLTAQDTWGNTVTTFNAATDNVTIVANAPLVGTVSGLGSGGNNVLNQAGNFTSGVANLTTLGMKYTGNTATGTFTASSGSGKSGTSGNVTISAGTLHHFAVATIASPQTAGTAFSITITAQDSNNNTVTSFTANGNKVILTSTGALTGAPITTAAFTNGVLTMNVTITNTGTFTITATGTGGNSGVTGISNQFQVNPGQPNKLAFLEEPTDTTAGQTISPAITVQIQDANGNLTNSTASVGIAILNNPGTGTLSGTTPVNAVSGTATFSNLSISKGGLGYTLQATSASLTPATSASFTINNPAPTLTSISPDNGNLSATLDVVFNGSGYISGVSSVNFADSNITVNTTTVNSSSKITANITIGAGAVIGGHSVSVTNSGPGGGTSGTQTFTVNDPATTTVVTSSSPLNTSTYGDSVTFTATVTSQSGTPTGSVIFYDGTCSGTALTVSINLDANGKATFSTSSLNATTHTITVCYSPTGIFLASNGSVTQTVGRASLEITGKSFNKQYGVTYTFTGMEYTISNGTLYNGDTISSVALSGTGAAANATVVAPGPTYTITAGPGVTFSVGSPDNYSINFVNGTLTVTKAPLQITAKSFSKQYGLTYTFTGTEYTISNGTLYNGDTISSVALTSAGAAASATVVAPGPTYTLTAGPGVTFSVGSTGNYYIAFVSGTLTVTKAPLQITAKSFNKQYGLAYSFLGSEYTISNGTLYNGDTISSVALSSTGAAASATVVAPGPTYTILAGPGVTFSVGSPANYYIGLVNGTLTVTKAPLEITANSFNKQYGVTYTFTGSEYTISNGTLYNGDTISSVALTSAGTAAGATVAAPGPTYTITAGPGVTFSVGSSGNYYIAFVNGTLTITKAHLTVTADAESVQYSDPLPTLTATLSGFVNNENDAGLRSSGGLSGNPSFTAAATITFYSTTGVSNAPGTYTNALIPSLGSLSATNYDFATFNKGTLTVTQEDARAYYTGALFVSTSSATSGTATVTLSATIKDITAADPSSSPPNPDNYPGDIQQAKVTFINRDNNTVIVSNLSVGLVTAGDTKTGTATYNWIANIGTNDSLQYTIGIIVTGYYTRNSSDDDTVVTVSKAIPGLITGGGYLVEQSSAGLKAGGVGTKNNFGFNVKNASNGPKGNINTIVRNNGRTYQIKGNAMTSLATNLTTSVTHPYPTATFNGKASIQDITNPLLPSSVDGNATLQVTMTDKGEPGSSDSIAVTVWNKAGGLWFSSNWNGTKTIEQTLGGGNLQVR